MGKLSSKWNKRHKRESFLAQDILACRSTAPHSSLAPLLNESLACRPFKQNSSSWNRKNKTKELFWWKCTEGWGQSPTTWPHIHLQGISQGQYEDYGTRRAASWRRWCTLPTELAATQTEYSWSTAGFRFIHSLINGLPKSGGFAYHSINQSSSQSSLPKILIMRGTLLEWTSKF